VPERSEGGRGGLFVRIRCSLFLRSEPLSRLALRSRSARATLSHKGRGEGSSRRARTLLATWRCRLRSPFLFTLSNSAQPTLRRPGFGFSGAGRRPQSVSPCGECPFTSLANARGMERRLAPGAVRRSLTRDDAAGRYAWRGLARPMTPDARLPALHRGIVRLGTAHLCRTVGLGPPWSRRLSSPFSPAITADLSAPPLQ